ncbi:Sec1 family domain-containing protein 1 [Heterocephalus glaber]|uniref:Sec1 family domain-containing protein 1 n=1 Tax=Heterocephalus glaber TaxID=10181 RepID=G5B7T1_HETGA|nr:Sec1 family domain-containing protein 1 [Heterocephalus glaber]
MVGGKMAAAASIRERQTVALKHILNFNVPHVKNSTGEPVWKVLIYYDRSQDIISPLLSVKELRNMRITLHLLLHSSGNPIPDVPAVYFVMPTEENIDRMCQDLRNQLYESHYLNFISAISRSKLEDIANAALAASAITRVAKVFDQYLNFITLEDDMFVLCNQNKELVSYHAINRPDITDPERETVMDTIVDSLFCFFVTLGAVPINRCSRETPAEMVSVKLEHIKARKLDVYFEYEEKTMSKTTLDKSLLNIISDPDAGTPEDEIRLFLIYYISTQQASSEADLEQYKKSLTDAGCNLNPLQYIKQWKAFSKMASAPASYGNTTAKPMGLLSRVMNTRSQFVMEGVKNLILKQQNLPVTRILDNLMEMKSNPETDDYRYFDPKMLRGNDSSVPRNKNPLQEATVFVVGGGNYIEYQNLVAYIKGKQGKHILYGCSELCNPTQFMRQLSQLGQK